MVTGHKKNLIELSWDEIKERIGIFSSIRIQLYAIIIILSILITSSLISTAFSVYDHSNDEIVIDTAHHQQNLAQRVTWMALSRSSNPDLTTLIQEFDQNLFALKEGGLVVGTEGTIVELPAHDNIAVQTQLSTVTKTWGDYRKSLVKINTLSGDDPLRQELSIIVQDQSVMVMDQITELIALLEEHMADDHRDLLSIQLIYLAIALPLIIWGSYVIRRRIVIPLTDLKEAARLLGQGNFSVSVKANGKDEVSQLAQTFEDMRSEIAANNILMETRIAERIHELSVAFEFSQEIVSQQEFNGLLEAIIAKARNLMRTEHVSLCLVKPNGNTIEMFANNLGVLSGNKPQQSIDVVGEIVNKDHTIDAQVNDLACEFLKPDTSNQCLAVPLRVGDRTIGALCVLRDVPLPFEKHEKRAFALLANSAAIAIDNARLIKESELQTRQNAIFAERQRLASELHDNLAQTLNFLNLKITQIQKRIAEFPDIETQSEIKLVQENVETAIDQVRMVVSEMASPTRTDENEFLEQLKTIVEEFDETAGTSVYLEVSGLGESVNHLTQLAQKQLLMIIKEALTNVRRHAVAENVAIRFSFDQDCIRVAIEDDGKGFQPEIDRGNHHIGLHIMHTRAERSGGTVNIESAPNKGTRVIVSLPLENRRQTDAESKNLHR